MPGLVPVTPEGGKVARAQAVRPQVESGNVYLPHPALAPWVESLIDECGSFPNGKYDDQVDQMTQALNRLRGLGIMPGPPAPDPLPPGNEYSWTGCTALTQRGLMPNWRIAANAPGHSNGPDTRGRH